MWLRAEKILEMIPQLEESDKAISGATARDPIMQGQTNIFFGLGMSRDQNIMKAGYELYSKTLAEFKSQMIDLVSRYQGKGLGIDKAIAEWKAITGANYKTMFKAGAMAVGNPYYDKIGLPDKDLAFMAKARRFESSFFKKFLMDIDNPNHVAVHPYLQRAEYYAESGKAQFFNGMVNGAGDDLEIHWVLSEQPEEHCEDCPVLASRKWTWRTLPTTPRAGDTACMFRCYCHLEFQPAPSTSARSYAGSATPQALSAEGRWGSVTDLQGNRMGGQIAAEIDDMFGAMFKARQMISLTDGPEKAEWIGIRREINKGIIDRAGQDYRALPNVSVSQLEIAAKAANGMGAALVSDIGGLRAGAEAVFLRGNFYTSGLVSELSGAKYLIDTKGNRYRLNDETDIVFIAKEQLNPIDPRERNVAKLLKRKVFGSDQLYQEFLGYYDVAKAANSAIPYQRAWVAFRQRWQETGVGWVQRRTNEQIEEGGAGSGNFDHAGRPGEVGGSGEGGAEMGNYATRDFHGLVIDAELKNSWIDRMNVIDGVDVVSSCAGHKGQGQGIGGTAFPGINFRMHSVKDEETAARIRKLLSDDTTNVETTTWAGPYGNWATRVNGDPRLEVFKPEDIDKFPVDHISFHIKSTLPNSEKTGREEIDVWWEKTLKNMESIPKLLKKHESIIEGGSGSGNFAHAGRPGEVGGSAPEGEINTDPSSPDQTYLPDKAEVDVGIGTREAAPRESVKEFLVSTYTMSSGNSAAWQDVAGKTYGIDAAQQALSFADPNLIGSIARTMQWENEMRLASPNDSRMWHSLTDEEHTVWMSKATSKVLEEIRERLGYRWNSSVVNSQAVDKQILALRDEANAVATEGADLHRGMSISRELADEIDSAIRTKGSYEMKVNPVSSYTESPKLAERFAIKGEGGHKPDKRYVSDYAPIVYSVKGNKTDTWVHYKQPTFLKVSADKSLKFHIGGKTQKEVVMGHPKGTVTLTNANYRRLGWD